MRAFYRRRRGGETAVTIFLPDCGDPIRGGMAGAGKGLKQMMHDSDKGGLPEGPEEEEARISRSLAGLAAALAIIVGGLYLAMHLKSVSDAEDCLLAHHVSCTLIQAGDN